MAEALQVARVGISILAVLADRDGRLRLSPSSPQFIFQSSRSLRTATLYESVHKPDLSISILAVLADRDVTVDTVPALP